MANSGAEFAFEPQTNSVFPRNNAILFMTVLSKQGIAELFLLHRQDLERFLMAKVSCPEIAADLTQEAYLRVTNRTNLDQIENFRAYLFSVANNLAIDHLRRRSRQLKRDGGELSEDVASPAPEPEVVLSDRQQIEFLEQVIYSLPPKCRQVFLLCRVDEKSYAEVAEQLGISARTVESHMRKALDHIRKSFS